MVKFNWLIWDKIMFVSTIWLMGQEIQVADCKCWRCYQVEIPRLTEPWPGAPLLSWSHFAHRRPSEGGGQPVTTAWEGGGGAHQTLHFIFGPTHRRSHRRNQVWKKENVLTNIIWIVTLRLGYNRQKSSLRVFLWLKVWVEMRAAGRVLGWGELLAPLASWPGSWVEGGGGRNLSSDEILTHLHRTATHSQLQFIQTQKDIRKTHKIKNFNDFSTALNTQTYKETLLHK